MTNLAGEVVRVSAAIDKNEEGEVMATLAGGSQAFPARAYDQEAAFPVGARVLVLEQAGRTVYVTEPR